MFHHSDCKLACPALMFSTKCIKHQLQTDTFSIHAKEVAHGVQTPITDLPFSPPERPYTSTQRLHPRSRTGEIATPGAPIVAPDRSVRKARSPDHSFWFPGLFVGRLCAPSPVPSSVACEGFRRATTPRAEHALVTGTSHEPRPQEPPDHSHAPGRCRCCTTFQAR